MLSVGWTELLLDTEGITDIAVVLLKGLDVNRKFNSLSDFAVLFRRVVVDVIPSAIDILYRIGDDFSLPIISK